MHYAAAASSSKTLSAPMRKLLRSATSWIRRRLSIARLNTRRRWLAAALLLLLALQLLATGGAARRSALEQAELEALASAVQLSPVLHLRAREQLLRRNSTRLVFLVTSQARVVPPPPRTLSAHSVRRRALTSACALWFVRRES